MSGAAEKTDLEVSCEEKFSDYLTSASEGNTTLVSLTFSLHIPAVSETVCVCVCVEGEVF